MAAPELLLPKLVPNFHLFIPNTMRRSYFHYGDGDGMGMGDAPNEYRADMHAYGRGNVDTEGDGLGEGEHSWQGSNTYIYNDGEGYA